MHACESCVSIIHIEKLPRYQIATIEMQCINCAVAFPETTTAQEACDRESYGARPAMSPLLDGSIQLESCFKMRHQLYLGRIRYVGPCDSVNDLGDVPIKPVNPSSDRFDVA